MKENQCKNYNKADRSIALQASAEVIVKEEGRRKGWCGGGERERERGREGEIEREGRVGGREKTEHLLYQEIIQGLHM